MVNMDYCQHCYLITCTHNLVHVYGGVTRDTHKHIFGYYLEINSPVAKQTGEREANQEKFQKKR